MKLKQDTEETAEPSTKWLKTKVWKVKTSSKIKHFLWQSLSDCLPVCDRLVERHCGRDRSCPRCGANRETTNHLLFESPGNPGVGSRRYTFHSGNLPEHIGFQQPQPYTLESKRAECP
ncbi:hypothetical protein Bca52824_041578 [Brassica carinata]|uniref:Reverse transcriptase zinc-binding domain-containing protein n=1 Tax=Brassica carinata TaxID=52824 RepID=A0A8X7RZZ7_BRACI|nr:hypothetical protein Bca52824_041578 [Brassica carinata]